MAIHILGNGPSISAFDRGDWPSSDIRVGCNFSNESFDPNYTVIVDVRAMKQFRGGAEAAYHLGIPAVLSDRAYNYIADTRGGWNRIPDSVINVIDVIPLHRDKKISNRLAGNSGHHGTMYSIESHPDQSDEVHIWGCDSFWGPDIRSHTDSIVNHTRDAGGARVRAGVVAPWRKYWTQIFEWYRATQFFIHTSRGVSVSDIRMPREWKANVDVVTQE